MFWKTNFFLFLTICSAIEAFKPKIVRPPECSYIKCSGSCDGDNNPPVLGFNGKCYALFVNKCLMKCVQLDCNLGFTKLTSENVFGPICEVDINGCYY